MNWKILVAFAAGALIASGIVYMAVKDAPVAAAPAVSAEVPRSVAAPAVPVAAAVPAPAPTVPAAPPPIVPAARSIRQKPSPMPPAIRRERPVTVARVQNPPVRMEAPPQTTAQAPPDPKPPVEAQIPSEPEQPAPARVFQQPAPPPEEVPAPPREPEMRVPHTVTIAAGTLLQVRIGETISAAHYQVGDVFLATLDRPLVVEGFIIAERGSRVEGRVVEAQPAGRGNTTSRLGIDLVKLSTSDGQRVQLRTQPYRKDAASSAGGDVAKVGVGGALGAVTRGRTAEIPVESRISFRIEGPITITERLN
jgi:outer membrane biosynthesis protein TonB